MSLLGLTALLSITSRLRDNEKNYTTSNYRLQHLCEIIYTQCRNVNIGATQ
ncbi:hypothetical protein VP382E491_P0075 [Vibrio phage 382E49-1]|nr:hypothetical protein VP382E491_P0075 [Vibrio phage 382E49-1]